MAAPKRMLRWLLRNPVAIASHLDNILYDRVNESRRVRESLREVCQARRGRGEGQEVDKNVKVFSSTLELVISLDDVSSI